MLVQHEAVVEVAAYRARRLEQRVDGKARLGAEERARCRQ